MANWKQRLFGMPLEETTFTRRGFSYADDGVRIRLEEIGRVFLSGYHAALACDDISALCPVLNTISLEDRGFAFEGAAMGLYLQDTLLPWKRARLQAFLKGPGNAHCYMAHVGAGWVLARLKRRVEKPMERLDPLLRWLAIDGYGFHEGYFYPGRYIERQQSPTALSGYALRAFDQGLGRSLWFSRGADAAGISGTICDFAPDRRADLWSGIGLACAYAGGVARSEIETLREHAGTFGPQLAQGVAFAAKTRIRAGNLAQHTEWASQILCDLSAEEAAAITDAALLDLAPTPDLPAYEVWRQRIQSHFPVETPS